jgi:mRNA degradation ribonuclease J1/J2
MKKIELNNVSVSYIVGDFSNRGLKDVVIQKLKGKSTEKEFVAVKNVTFAIEEGELLGIVVKTMESCSEQNLIDWNTVKNKVKSNLSSYLYKTTQRSPMILPMITEI